jgi:hypothetical protein
MKSRGRRMAMADRPLTDEDIRTVPLGDAQALERDPDADDVDDTDDDADDTDADDDATDDAGGDSDAADAQGA